VGETNVIVSPHLIYSEKQKDMNFPNGGERGMVQRGESIQTGLGFIRILNPDCYTKKRKKRDLSDSRKDCRKEGSLKGIRQ